MRARRVVRAELLAAESAAAASSEVTLARAARSDVVLECDAIDSLTTLACGRIQLPTEMGLLQDLKKLILNNNTGLDGAWPTQMNAYDRVCALSTRLGTFASGALPHHCYVAACAVAQIEPARFTRAAWLLVHWAAAAAGVAVAGVHVFGKYDSMCGGVLPDRVHFVLIELFAIRARRRL